MKYNNRIFGFIMLLLAVIILSACAGDHYYMVSFDAAGGLPEPEYQMVQNGRFATEPEELPVKEGYTFGGWYVSGNKFDFKTPILLNLVLEAKWDVVVARYNVNFNSNGGSFIPSLVINEGGLITEPTIPSKDESNFAGWFTDASLTIRWNFSIDTVNKDLILYAKWTDLDVVVVVFNSNGGSKVGDFDGSIDALVTKPNDPTKEGYTFVGWFKEETFVNPWDFESDKIENENMITLYAKWSANDVVVVFDSKDGTKIANFPGKFDGLVTKPSDPTKEGYKFAGWFKEEKLVNQWDFSNDTINEANGLTLYAKWDLDSFTVTFQTNSSLNISPKLVGKNTTLSVIDLALADKTFIGWYLDKDFTSKVANEIVVTKDITLYARWIDVADATIVNDTMDLQVVLDQINDGDTVFLMPGTYVVDNLTITKSITLLGNNFGDNLNKEASIIVPVLKPNFQEHGTRVIMVSAPNVTIDGITVDGDNPFEENKWTKAQQDFLENYRSSQEFITRSSAVLDAVIAHYKNMIGKDIKLDVAIGICVDTGLGINESFTLINSEVKNFFQAGVYIFSGATSSGQLTSSMYAKATIKNNLFENINVLTVLNKGEYLGHYGRSVEFSYGIYGEISDNIFSESSVGVQIQNNYKNEKPLLIDNNQFDDVNTGIWFNESSVNSQTDISNNLFTFSGEDFPSFVLGQNTAIALSGLSYIGDDARLLIANNSISHYQYGVLLGSLNAAGAIDIIDNSFNSLDSAYAVTDFFMSYKVTAGVFVNIHENEYQDINEVFYKEIRGNGGLIKVSYYKNDQLVMIDTYGILATPTNLKISGTNISWNTVASAMAYEVYFNGIKVATTTETSYSLLEISGDTIVEIVAISDEATVFASDKSVAVTVIKITIETDTYKANNVVDSVTTNNYYLVGKTKYSTLLKAVTAGYEVDLDWALKGSQDPYIFNPDEFFMTSNHFYRASYQIVKITYNLKGALNETAVAAESVRVNSLIDLYVPTFEENYLKIDGYYTDTKFTAELLVDQNNQHLMIATINVYIKVVDIRLKSPTGLKITGTNLVWTAVADAINYEVYDDGILVSSQTALTYSLLELNDDTTFYVIAIADANSEALNSVPSVSITIIKVVLEVETISLAGASSTTTTTSYLISGVTTYVSKLPINPTVDKKVLINWQIKGSNQDFTYEEGAKFTTSNTFYRKVEVLAKVTYHIGGDQNISNYKIEYHDKNTLINLLVVSELSGQNVETIGYYSDAKLTNIIAEQDGQYLLTGNFVIYIKVQTIA